MIGHPQSIIRVGHKGADLIAPGNTTESFDAALAAGVDMIEFDVLPEHPPEGRAETGSGALIIAHDYADAGRRAPLRLEDALAHLARPAFAGVALDVDLKLPGYEERVVAAVRAAGLVERTLISSQYKASLTAIRAVEPRIRLGWSVPKLRRDPFRSPLLIPAGYAAAAVGQRVLPPQAAAMIRRGRCDALMSHWRLVSPRLVRAVAGAGGELYVWTVDEPDRIRSLRDLGVTGVITNDPRLFAALA